LQDFGYDQIQTDQETSSTEHIALPISPATGFIPGCVAHICNHMLGMFREDFRLSISPLLILICVVVGNMRRKVINGHYFPYVVA